MYEHDSYVILPNWITFPKTNLLLIHFFSFLLTMITSFARTASSIEKRSVLILRRGVAHPVFQFSTSSVLNEQTEIELFPWRSEPSSRSIVQYVVNFYRVFRASWTFRSMTENEEDKAELRHTLSGSLWALKCATTGIFQHNLMSSHYHNIKDKNMLKVDGLVNQELESVDLSDIFDQNMINFYNSAIQKHCSQSNRMCVYSLLKVHGADFVNLEIMALIQRGGRVPVHDHQETFGGMTFLFPALIGDHDHREKQLEKVLDDLDEDKNSTIRATVEVQCSGVTSRVQFHVSDS